MKHLSEIKIGDSFIIDNTEFIKIQEKEDEKNTRH